MGNRSASFAAVALTIGALVYALQGCSSSESTGASGDVPDGSSDDGAQGGGEAGPDALGADGGGWIPLGGQCVDLSQLPRGGTSVSNACSGSASCGGKPEGTWSAQSACMSGTKAFSQAYGVCSALSLSSVPGNITGQIKLEGGVLTRDLTVTFSASLSLPNACTGCRCTDAETQLRSTGLDASCGPVCNSGTCSCTVNAPLHIQDSEGYTVSGNVITTQS